MPLTAIDLVCPTVTIQYTITYFGPFDALLNIIDLTSSPTVSAIYTWVVP